MGWKIQKDQKIDLHNYNYWLKSNAPTSQRSGLAPATVGYNGVSMRQALCNVGVIGHTRSEPARGNDGYFNYAAYLPFSR